MKGIKSLLIMFCLSFLFLNTGCEKTADQTTARTDSQKSVVTSRTILTECDECPIGCCCCGILNVDPPSYTLEICGLCEGDYHCGSYNPDPPCEMFSGLGKDVTFNSMHTHEIICIEPGATFRIYNPSGSLTVYFRFSCQYDITNPTFINVSLTPGQSKYFHNDGECISEGPC